MAIGVPLSTFVIIGTSFSMSKLIPAESFLDLHRDSFTKIVLLTGTPDTLRPIVWWWCIAADGIIIFVSHLAQLESLADIPLINLIFTLIDRRRRAASQSADDLESQTR